MQQSTSSLRRALSYCIARFYWQYKLQMNFCVSEGRFISRGFHCRAAHIACGSTMHTSSGGRRDRDNTTTHYRQDIKEDDTYTRHAPPHQTPPVPRCRSGKPIHLLSKRSRPKPSLCGSITHIALPPPTKTARCILSNPRKLVDIGEGLSKRSANNLKGRLT